MFTIARRKTFTYIFVAVAQLKRLCKFFSTPFAGPPPFGYTYVWHWYR